MVQSLVDGLPYVKESAYKQDAMVLHDKAQKGELGTVQMNLIVGADQNTIVDLDTHTFAPFIPNGQSQVKRGALGACITVDSSVTDLNRTHHNITVVAARPDTKSDNADLVIHELGHAIAAAASTDAENMNNDADTFGTDGGTNTEHTEFVLPVTNIGLMVYESAVESGLADQAFKYTEQS
jgi:hypothetical protein